VNKLHVFSLMGKWQAFGDVNMLQVVHTCSN